MIAGYHLSSFSTQHAQRCVPARSVVTQWVCYPENHVNAFFWIKETHLATLRPTRDPKQNRSGECIFSGSQIVFCNYCFWTAAWTTNYCCLRNCLRPQRSPPASGMGSNRDFEHEVPPPCTKAPCPHARGSGTPAAENCLSSSSSISSSSSCSEALVSCRKRFVKRKKCIRPCGSVLNPG